MNFTGRFYIAFTISTFLFVGVCNRQSCAQEEPAAEATKAENRLLDMHKVGRFQIERPGVPFDIYARSFQGLANKPYRAKEGGRWVVEANKKNVLFEVDVPDNYNKETPFGVFVFISASESGKLPKEYYRIFGKHNIISIAANNSGNSHGAEMRIGRAVFAVRLLNEAYNLDIDRIYLSGGSGGGRAASIGMMLYQDIFSGGLPMIGADPVISMKNAASEELVYSDPGMPGFSIQALQVAATMGRYAFITGEKDFNKTNCQMVARGYQKAGFRNVTCLVEPGLGHSLPSATWLEKGLEFVDAPLADIAEAKFGMAKKLLYRQPGVAMRCYKTVLLHGEKPEQIEKANAELEKLETRFQNDFGKTRTRLKKTKTSASQKLVQRFVAKWGVTEESRQMFKAIEERGEK